MKLRAVSGIMLSLLLTGMLALAFNIQPVKAGTIIVPDDYPTIQAAINAANLGDVIYVKEGIYYEKVIVNKTVSLVGENRSTTIVDGSFRTGFHVISDYVNISGFTIQNCGPPEGGLFAGIHLDSCINCNISGNILNNNYAGIWPDSSSNNNISNNSLSNCGYAIGSAFMKGNNQNIFNNYMSDNTFDIYLADSRNSVVSNNTILNTQKLSIYLQYCNNAILTNNNMTNNIHSLKVVGSTLSDFIHDIDVSNTVDGKPVYYLINQSALSIDPVTFPEIGYLGLVNSTNITVKNLNLTRSGQGLLLAYTTHSTVMHLNISSNHDGIDIFSSSNNTITDNKITSNVYMGIYMHYDCDNNTIINNTVSNNGNDAIGMSGSDGNIIKNNTLSNNYRGILIFHCEDNKIYHNSFDENMEQISCFYSANAHDNGYPSGGNYWSDYTGVDVKSGPNQDQPSSDGIGDTPYVIDENNQDNYPLMYPWGSPPPPSYTLKIYSPSTGVWFTVDGVYRTTPWSGTYSEGASVSLVMPETHYGYEWSHWLEDGDPNRIKTVTMDTDITLTGVFARPVGGKATPINLPMNNPETSVLWMWLTTIILSLIVTVLYFKKRKRKPEIKS